MACQGCRRRSALLGALAPTIERIEPLGRESLLSLLALDERALCHAAKVSDPRGLIRRVEARIAESVRVAPAAPARCEPEPAPGTGPGAHPRARAHAPCSTNGRSGAVCRHDAAYPRVLAQSPSAPAVLHATCTPERLTSLLTAPTVAIIGRRVHTDYAHRVAFALARDLATAGVTILSGLHQGIDGIAQHGAMHANGRSIAVTGCGPDRPYPRQLEHLHHRIRARGAIVAELPPGHHPPRRWSLLATQRIVAGLAEVIVVVEAEKSSSEMLAVQIAADLGHEVAAVPGRVTDRGGQGTLELIRDGAHPVGCAQDVLDLLQDRPSIRATAAAA